MITILPSTIGPAPFRFAVSVPSPGIARVVVAGEIDAANAPMLGLQLLAVLEVHRPTTIEMDLSDVAFLDCPVIAVLVDVGAAARLTRSHLSIIGSQPEVKQLLAQAHLLTCPNEAA